MGIILTPFAWLLMWFYDFFQSYGFALILFALVIKLVLFPFNLKGKKSMIQMNLLSGKMQQLQKQYGKDRERYNMEVQKLYEKEKVNPMSGCLWSFIPIIFLMVLYAIIREPLTYFMHLSMEQIQLIAQELDWQTAAVANGWMSQNAMNELIEQVANGELTSVFQNGSYNQMYLASLITPENLASIQALLGDAGANVFAMNFSFLGISLANIPQLKFWVNGMDWSTIGLFLLPLVSVAISFLSMQISMKTNQMNRGAPQDDQTAKTNRTMMIVMPLMSLWIGFTVPAGLSVYWIAQYIFSIFQELICGRILKKDYEKARAAAAERERQEKEEEKQRKEEARLERQRRLEEEKKNRGKKKPKKLEPTEPGINREDSRIGMRTYARGRAYEPNRFGGVQPYRDPSDLIRAQEEAENNKKNKRGKKDKNKTQEPAPAVQEVKEVQEAPQEQAAQLTEAPAAPEEKPAEQTAAPVQESSGESAAPAQEAAQPAPQETEEVEVEVEQVEVELPEEEDDKKEGV